MQLDSGTSVYLCINIIQMDNVHVIKLPEKVTMLRRTFVGLVKKKKKDLRKRY